jgi:ABC-type transport system involved in multi-copper enzyme maturation permease subunit
MTARLEPVFIVTMREIRDQFRDWRVIFPVVVLTLVFPVLMKFTASQALGFVQQYDATIIAERLFPFLMMVVGFFPITVSLVIALESFVGEKERRSLEPLLSSPLADWQIYLGKLLAALLVPTLASYLGTTVYLVWIWRELSWTPSAELLALILVLVAVQALVMVSGAVVVSSQTTSVRAANLLASFIIIPMALLMQGESIAMFWGYTDVLWGAAAAQLVIAVLLVRMGIASFNREELLGREIDSLNPRWWWQVFRTAFKGEASSLGEWLRREIPATLKRIGVPVGVAALLLALACWSGDISRKLPYGPGRTSAGRA